MYNTHTYDGKLNINTQMMVKMSFEQAVNEILQRYPQTKNVCQLILVDRQGNIDHLNHVSFEYFLPMVWECIKDSYLESIFIEQYIDILRGPCAQGRITRIYQVWEIYLNDQKMKD